MATKKSTKKPAELRGQIKDATNRLERSKIDAVTGAAQTMRSEPRRSMSDIREQARKDVKKDKKKKK